MNEKYRDILNMPHHKSLNRPHMPASDRAAQFLPFAALTGYDAAILETARQTIEKKELSNEDKEKIGTRLAYLKQNGNLNQPVCIIYFEHDLKKSGGCYKTIESTLIKVDDFKHEIMVQNIRISFKDIYRIESTIFNDDNQF